MNATRVTCHYIILMAVFIIYKKWKDKMGKEKFFIAHADDSSDDESVSCFSSNETETLSASKKSTSLNEESLVRSLKDFHLDTEAHYGENQDSKRCLYFSVYQIGIGLLYHSKVERIYSALKQQYMGESEFHCTSSKQTDITDFFKQYFLDYDHSRSEHRRHFSLLLNAREKWFPHRYAGEKKSFIESARKKGIFIHHDNLPTNFHLISSNIYEYLANLRLTNRSAKRTLAAMAQAERILPETVVRSYELKPNPEYSLVQQKFSYNREKSACSRTDLELNLGSYASDTSSSNSIIKIITLIKNNYSLDDAQIAKYVRQMLKHEETKIVSQELKKILISLTNLLFGIEAVRRGISTVCGKTMQGYSYLA